MISRVHPLSARVPDAVEGSTSNRKRITLPNLFLVLALVIGSLYATLMAPLQVPDEFAHFVRAYTISHGACIANPDVELPVNVARLGTTYAGHVESRRPIMPSEIWTALQAPLDQRRTLRVGYVTSNIYNCVPYLASSGIIGFGRMVNISPLGLMYMGRVANLLACSPTRLLHISRFA